VSMSASANTIELLIFMGSFLTKSVFKKGM